MPPRKLIGQGCGFVTVARPSSSFRWAYREPPSDGAPSMMNPTPELVGDGVCRSDDWLPRTQIGNVMLVLPRPDPFGWRGRHTLMIRSGAPYGSRRHEPHGDSGHSRAPISPPEAPAGDPRRPLRHRERVLRRPVATVARRSTQGCGSTCARLVLARLADAAVGRGPRHPRAQRLGPQARRRDRGAPACELAIRPSGPNGRVHRHRRLNRTGTGAGRQPLERTPPTTRSSRRGTREAVPRSSGEAPR
jgi:hypothetical protein